MSLPWFPYHIDKFLSDTLELDGPAVGAYHLLMLHYYATGKPPRDNDRVLATIARLPIDAWMERRPEIETLFQIRDGVWHHATIEAEMAEAEAKHAAGIARARAGAVAMHAKKGHKPASRTAHAMPQAVSEQARRALDALSSAAGKPKAVPKQCLTDAQSTLTKESLSLVLDVTVEKDNSGDNSADQQQAEQEEALGTPIDPKFWPCENHITVCNIDGADAETVMREVRGFIATHQERGTFSHDWDASWTMWWKRWKDHRDKDPAKKPKPRIEVSSRFEPSSEQWATACAKLAKDGSGWSRQYGPEPGLGGCRCPQRIIIESGLDPDTGLKLTPVQIVLRLEKLSERV